MAVRLLSRQETTLTEPTVVTSPYSGDITAALPFRAESDAWLNEVKHAGSVLIGTHLNPDGDALGSALAVSFYLDGLGIRNEVICHHPAPKNLRFLPGVSRIRQIPVEEKHDLGIILDLDSSERLGDAAPYFQGCQRIIVVDHHIPHEKPGDVRIIDTGSAATAVILTRLLRAIGAPFTPEISTCLLTGIVTDTGSFRYRNTNPESLAAASFLLEHGGDINLVSEEIFQSKPLASQRLLGHVLETMQLEANGQIAWSAVSLADFEWAQAKDEDTEGFVNELLFIETVRIATLLREPKPGKVRASLRSRADIDVAAVARLFGGGGHRNAAGCTFDGTLEEVEQILIRELKLCLASS